jgi:ParB-like chromosome segregation protein Spo0J
MTIEEAFDNVRTIGAIGPSGIEWRLEKRRVGDLNEWDRNPRRITEEQAKHLAKSIIKFGYVEPVVVDTHDTIIGGHMRIRVMQQAKLVHPDDEIDVVVPNRDLTPDEFSELAIRLNKNTGTWDFDVLSAEFDQTNLREWGFSPMEFGMMSKDLKPTTLKPAAGEKVCPACGAVLP